MIFVRTGFLIAAVFFASSSVNNTFADEAPPLPTLCADWQALEKRIRAGELPPDEAERLMAALHEQLTRALGGSVPGSPFVFPLKGLNARHIGGKSGEGYYASKYDFYNPWHRSGHPALDIFIDDDNEDTIDDKTGQKVEVISSDAGVVVALNADWDKQSDDRGGKYVWIFSPAHQRYCYYAHLDSVSVKIGDVVGAGATLGLLGRTGKNAHKRRSPTHLHQMCLVFEKGRLKPRKMFKELTAAYILPRDADKANYRFAKGTIARRVSDFEAPAGFARTAEPDGTFAAWCRRLPLSNDDSIDLDLPRGFSGAAAALRAENLYAKRLSQKIGFEVSPGLVAAYVEWLEGHRLKVAPELVEWMTKVPARAPQDHGYANFRAYVRNIAPAAWKTANPAGVSRVTAILEIRPGDMFWNPAAPEWAVVLDVVADAAGKKKFLAASFDRESRLLKMISPAGAKPPWLDAEGLTTVPTPGWTFTANDLVRVQD